MCHVKDLKQVVTQTAYVCMYPQAHAIKFLQQSTYMFVMPYLKAKLAPGYSDKLCIYFTRLTDTEYTHCVSYSVIIPHTHTP